MSTPDSGGAAASTTPPSTPTDNTNTPASTDNAAAAAKAVADAKVAADAKAAEAKKDSARRKKYQLKVDGREEEVELDLDNEEEIKKHLQMSKVSQKRMQETAEYKKNFASFVEALRKDPAAVLADPRLQISEEQRKKLAEKIINSELEEMSKTPEQREKERLQKEYETLKKQFEEEKKAKEQADFQRMQQQWATELDKEIADAIEKTGMPKTSYSVKLMAEAMMFADANGLTDIKAADLAPYVKKQMLSNYRELVSSLPDEDFEDWVGKDRLKNMRKKNIQKVKAAVEAASSIKPTGDTGKNTDQAKKIPMKDFFKKW